MDFTSTVFLFLFLPVLLAFYWLAPRSVKNVLLFLASLVFYAWGDMRHLWVLAGSILINYVLALAISHVGKTLTGYLLLVVGIICNLSLLAWFKYAAFCLDNLNFLFSILRLPGVTSFLPTGLPLGISFFTFSVLSCLLDVYRGQTWSQRNLLHFALFVSFFPKLVQGPICRFADIISQFSLRDFCSLDDFSYGVRRFMLGLCKKMLLANTLGRAADGIMALTIDQLTAPLAWLGAACYTLQIYFDFLGYSDMAVGMGRLFGLRLMENFNFPYTATSIRDFWRRWHISLSYWFRDYLYIPLGGSRVSTFRTYFNLCVVFFFCGLWHGASWNFVIWGAIHGFCSALEHFDNGRIYKCLPVFLQRGYTLLTVLVGWIFFRIETLAGAVDYLQAMLGQGSGDGIEYNLGLYLDRELSTTFVAAVILCMPLAQKLACLKLVLYRYWRIFGILAESIEVVGLVVLWVVSILYVASGTYNPFIYFRF